jgi:hypothetical protein
MYADALVNAVALGCIFVMSSGAFAAGAHVHGLGKLDAAIDDNTLTLQLDTPLESFVGFEHKPRTDKERAAVQRMAKTLRSDTAFVPTPAAYCKLKEVTLRSGVLDVAMLTGGGSSQAGTKPAAASKQAESDGHADLDGEYTFTCADPGALNSLEVRLFDAFPHLERLDVQVIGPRGQTGGKLTAKNRTLRW